MTLYNFTSTKRLYAEVRASLESYFSVGAMDDTLFDLWVKAAIDRLDVTAKQKSSAYINVDNFKGTLPEDFDKMHDVWVCTSDKVFFQDPTSTYYQSDYTFEDQCEDVCGHCKAEQEDKCTCDEDFRDCKLVSKRTGTTVFNFSRQRRLKAGDSFTRDNCEGACPAIQTNADGTFQISGCHIYTSMRSGGVQIKYYTKNIDEDGDLIIPDNVYVNEWLRSLLMTKLFEKLLNETYDETFNQVAAKKQMAEKATKDAYMNLTYNLKMPSKDKIIAANTREKRRFNKVKRRYY